LSVRASENEIRQRRKANLNHDPGSDDIPPEFLFPAPVKEGANKRDDKKKELPRLRDEIIAKPQIHLFTDHFPSHRQF
jgi:hypothetical protein